MTPPDISMNGEMTSPDISPNPEMSRPAHVLIPAPPISRLRDTWWAWRLRWRRRDFMTRAIRARLDLAARADRTRAIRRGDILAVTVLRNEAPRLPAFLAHYRAIGVNHFLIVDNDSDDGSADLLADQPDVSLWTTAASYRDARFGMDWANRLLMRYGHRHWCVTVDADERLVYPGWPDRGLRDLTARLDAAGRPGMGALMLDLFPRGAVGSDPALDWFDAGPYRTEIQQPRRNRWTRGGTRARAFFADNLRRAPTLNKLPLMRWDRRWAYMVSTHSILPRRLNDLYDGPGGRQLSGVLLHDKFSENAPAIAAREAARGQHFNDPAAFGAYYAALAQGPVLWHTGAHRWRGEADDLINLGLMGTGATHPLAGAP